MKFYNPFKKKVAVVVNSSTLENDSKQILNIFTTTVSNLQNVIDSAKVQISVKEAEIKTAELEKFSLSKIVEKNEQIVSKISDFIKLYVKI